MSRLQAPLMTLMVASALAAPAARADICTSLNDTNCYRFLCNGITAEGQIQGFCYQNTNQCTDATASRWDQPTISIRVDPDVVPQGLSTQQWASVVDDAFAAWTDVPGSNLNLQNIGDTLYRSFGANNTSHEVFWITNTNEYQSKVGGGVNNALGVTLSPRTCGNGVNSHGYIYDADLVMNGAGGFTWVDQNSNCPGIGCSSATSVLIHELGHFVGVDHPCVDCGWSIMAARSSLVDLETPAPVDRSAISALYPGVTGGMGYGCDNNNDCDAAPLCATVGALSYCTQTCGNCPDGFACQNIAGEGNICVFSEGSLAPPVGRGETCNPTPCEEGLECLQFQENTTEGECVAFCTPNAASNPECVAAYEDCFSITQDDSVGACIPVYGDVETGGTCTDDALCQRGNLCLLNAEGSADGTCYAECNPQDATHPTCGANDECVSVSEMDATLGVCVLSYGDVEDGGDCGADETQLCQRGSICLLVEEGADSGICFGECDTQAGGCGDNQQCAPLSNTGTDGVCLDVVGRGEPCGIVEVCEGDDICLLVEAGSDTGICFAPCDPQAADHPECGPNDVCESITQDNSEGVCFEAYGDVPTGSSCNGDNLCQIGNVCLLVEEGATDGLCFVECNPDNDTCAEGDECLELQGGGGACFPEPVQTEDGGTVIVIPTEDGGTVVVNPVEDGGLPIEQPGDDDAGSTPSPGVTPGPDDIPEVPDGTCRPERGNLDCEAGELCQDDGSCVDGAGDGAMGALCESGDDCESGLCQNGVCTRTCDVEGGCPSGYTCDEDSRLGGLCKADSCADDEGICEDGYVCTYTSASRYACATGVDPSSGCNCDAQQQNPAQGLLWMLAGLGAFAVRRRRR